MDVERFRGGRFRVSLFWGGSLGWKGSGFQGGRFELKVWGGRFQGGKFLGREVRRWKGSGAKG